MGGARQQKKSGSKKKGASRGASRAGRHDLQLEEPEPEPEPEMPTGGESNDSGDDMSQKDGRQHFRVINRAFVRSEFEINSTREGTVEVGEEIEALEMRHNENGVLRVRFSRGWVSSHGPDGSTILERTAAVSGRQLEARESLLPGKRPAGGSPSGEPSAGMAELLPDEEPTVYRVLNRAFIRGGFELDSRRQGTVEPGEEIVALELRDNQDGVTRVRFERGWVSVTGPDGTAILSEVNAKVPPQHGLLETALTEGLLDPDGRPKPLPAQATRAPQISQYALLHEDGSEAGGYASLSEPQMAAPAPTPARGTWPTIPTMDGAPAGATAGPFGTSSVLGHDNSSISTMAMQSHPDGSGPPHLQHGAIGGIWDGLMLGGGGSSGLASLAQVPRVSAAELVPDSASLTDDPNAVVRSLGTAQLEALRQALEEQRAALGAGGGGGNGACSSRLEEYTHENPAYPNPLEFALCRRESPGVMRALCAAFPAEASQLLPGGQDQLPLHAACVSGGNWLVPPSFSFGMQGEGEDTELSGEKIDDSAAEVVNILLQAHPEAARCADVNGCYPLHLAARHSPSPKVVETLLAEYAEAAGKPDKAGNLPLHLAFLRPLFKPGAIDFATFAGMRSYTNCKVDRLP